LTTADVQGSDPLGQPQPAKSPGKPAIEVLFKRFDAPFASAGFLAMHGQIIGARIIAVPKQLGSSDR